MRERSPSRITFVLDAPESQAVAVPVFVSEFPETEAPTTFVHTTGSSA